MKRYIVTIEAYVFTEDNVDDNIIVDVIKFKAKGIEKGLTFNNVEAVKVEKMDFGQIEPPIKIYEKTK